MSEFKEITNDIGASIKKQPLLVVVGVIGAIGIGYVFFKKSQGIPTSSGGYSGVSGGIDSAIGEGDSILKEALALLDSASLERDDALSEALNTVAQMQADSAVDVTRQLNETKSAVTSMMSSLDLQNKSLVDGLMDRFSKMANEIVIKMSGEGVMTPSKDVVTETPVYSAPKKKSVVTASNWIADIVTTKEPRGATRTWVEDSIASQVKAEDYNILRPQDVGEHLRYNIGRPLVTVENPKLDPGWQSVSNQARKDVQSAANAGKGVYDFMLRVGHGVKEQVVEDVTTFTTPIRRGLSNINEQRKGVGQTIDNAARNAINGVKNFFNRFRR